MTARANPFTMYLTKMRSRRSCQDRSEIVCHRDNIAYEPTSIGLSFSALVVNAARVCGLRSAKRLEGVPTNFVCGSCLQEIGYRREALQILPTVHTGRQQEADVSSIPVMKVIHPIKNTTHGADSFVQANICCMPRRFCHNRVQTRPKFPKHNNDNKGLLWVCS